MQCFYVAGTTSYCPCRRDVCLYFNSIVQLLNDWGDNFPIRDWVSSCKL